MSSATFAYTDAAIFYPNTTTSQTFSTIPCSKAVQAATQFRFDFYGEQLEVQIVVGVANPITVQVDGGTITTPTIPSTTIAYYTLTSGLTLGWHSVIIRHSSPNSGGIGTAAGWRITASDNAPSVRRTTGFAVWIPLAATGMLTDGKTTIANQNSYATSQKVSCGFRADRFRAKTNKLWTYFACGTTGSFFKLFIDGVAAGTSYAINDTTAGGFDFQDLAAIAGATLDATAFHEYEVIWGTSGSTINAIVAGYAFTVSQDATATYTARTKDAYVGDSIVVGAGSTSPFDSWPYLASRSRGAMAVSVGISGSQEAISGPTQGTSIGTWAPYDNLWNEYGTNDMNAANVDNPTPAWSTGDISTLNNMLATTPIARVLRLGIMLRTGATDARRALWNGVGTYGAQFNITLTNTPSRITYIDPIACGLVLATDYVDGLHPNAAGNIKIAAVALAAMGPVAITTAMFMGA